MSVKTYDPAEVQLIVGGVPISGYADGTFISIERDEQAFNKVTGADGRTSRAKTNNRAGNITITLQQTSDSNDVLSGFMIADEATGDGVVPVLVKDNSGRTLAATSAAWVQQSPGQEYSKDVENREWVMDCSGIDMFIGGNASQGGTD